VLSSFFGTTSSRPVRPERAFYNAKLFDFQKSFTMSKKMLFESFLSQILVFIIDTGAEMHDAEWLLSTLSKGEDTRVSWT